MAQPRSWRQHARSSDKMRDREHAPAHNARPRRSEVDERRGKLGADIGRRRGRCVLCQPRHLGNAFCRGTRPGRGHALRARPVRGGRHRCCRRLCADERTAGRDLAASRPRSRQRPCQHPQRQQGVEPDGQHRRRSRDLSPQVRRAADLRHRGVGAPVLALGQDLARREVDRRRWRRRDRRRAQTAGPDRDPDPAGRHRLERGFGPGSRSRPPPARARPRTRRSPRRRARCVRASRA